MAAFVLCDGSVSYQWWDSIGSHIIEVPQIEPSPVGDHFLCSEGFIAEQASDCCMYLAMNFMMNLGQLGWVLQGIKHFQKQVEAYSKEDAISSHLR